MAAVPRDVSLVSYKRVDAELSEAQVLIDINLNNKSFDEEQNFEIFWLELKRTIKLKWFQRLRNCLEKKSTSANLSERAIFENVNGSVKSGELTAILGPSGAGKTTLLDCLVGRSRPGTCGRVHIYGGASKKVFKICMIPQKDFLIEQLTVSENLQYASQIKNSSNPNVDHDKNVARVVSMLQLESCLHVKISNVSGGQHKRVSIAQELLSNPDILVLDEPTSGLDSSTCYRTILALKSLADMSKKNKIKPLAIVLTIHQPQIEVYELFDKVYFLSNIGKPIYEGRPQDSMGTIRSKLANLKFPTSHHYNPASLMIEIASTHHSIEVAQTLAQAHAEQFDLRFRKHLIEVRERQVSSEIKRLNNGLTQKVQDANNQIDHGPICPQPTRTLIDFDDSSFSTIDRSSLETNDDFTDSSLKSFDKRAAFKLDPNKDTMKDLLILDDELKVDDESSCTDGPTSDKQQMYSDPRMLRREDQRSEFWNHTFILTKRTWISTSRDSKVTVSKLIFHALIPVFMYAMYSNGTGSVDSCPYIERKIDVIDMANTTSERAKIMTEQLSITVENMTFFFMAVYGFSLCALALTALSFPMNMHVLLKETNNGWYSSGSFLLAKTLADFPTDFGLPMLTSIAIYKLTGQTSSPYEWRMLVVSLTITICTIISQTQGLLFGALFMNSVETSVFLSQALTMPLILVSGFVIRTARLPLFFKIVSYASIYRWATEIIGLARYGFGLCPCDPEIFQKEPIDFVGFPHRLRIYAYRAMEGLKKYKNRYNIAILKNKNLGSLDSYIDAQIPANIAGETFDSYFPDQESHEEMEDIFYNLAEQFSNANNLGRALNNCEDVKPHIITTFKYEEGNFFKMLTGLCILLLVMKIILIFVVRWALRNN